MQSPRAELIAEAAITLLAERGMRGLTHRAVDEVAGLPPGSTSNLARTRAALLELTLTRLSELEEQHFEAVGAVTGDAIPLEDAAELVMAIGSAAGAKLIGRLLYGQIYSDTRRTIARYELALEATRRPELRTIYDEAGQPFRQSAVEIMRLAGSPDPVRHGRQLVACCEGLMFDAIAGAGEKPNLADLEAAAADLLRGFLGSLVRFPGSLVRQGPWRPEIGQRAGLESGHPADPVAGQGQHHQSGRMHDAGLRVADVEAKGGLAVGRVATSLRRTCQIAVAVRNRPARWRPCHSSRMGGMVSQTSSVRRPMMPRTSMASRARVNRSTSLVRRRSPALEVAQSPLTPGSGAAVWLGPA
jgi:DNA-binding transcriptional regulator YbjK